MILIDANILLYAYQQRATQHERCRKWLEQCLNGREQIALAWISVLAFLRISTSARVFERPLLIHDAIGIVDSWFDRPQVVVLHHGDQYWRLLQNQLITGQVSGPLVMDADLAALATEHGAVLATADRDFARFEGLQLLDPTRS